MALGADGVISVVANQVPGPMHQLVAACARGDFGEGRRLHYALLRLMNLNFVESNPIPVKASLALMGLCEESFRLPMCPPMDVHAGGAAGRPQGPGAPLVSLAERIEGYYALPAGVPGRRGAGRLRRVPGRASRAGEVRAAEPGPDGWRVNGWVKKGILLGFRLGHIVETDPAGPLRFFDKDTFLPRKLTVDAGVRVVPGGSAVRAGAYVAPGVVIMPPAYVNVGAWVGEGALIDSHALVGSCAQVGRRVHLSAGAMLGGVLEPVGALPVIVEDEVLVGGNCGVYEGAVVGRRAVLGSGVILTGSVTVYDIPRRTTYRRQGDPAAAHPGGRGGGAGLAAPLRPVRGAPRPGPLHAGDREVPGREDRRLGRPGGRPQVAP